MRRSALSLIIGVVLAGAAVLLMMMFLRAPKPVAQAGVPMANIIIATEDMTFGTPLRREHLKQVIWPKTAVPDGAFASIDEIYAGGAKDGDRIALRMITKGEPLLKTKVSGFGEKATLSRRVANDKRAVTIRINDVTGVAGFLLPGDRVDVMLTREIGNSDNKVTDVILQNIAVLGIDQLTDEAREKPVVARAATVEVSPEEAQKLALAQDLGKLSLTLRNTENAEKVKTSRVSASDLTGSLKPVVHPPSVRVRNGDGQVFTKTVHP